MPPAAKSSDTAVAPPRSTIMSNIHRRATLLVTAVDELFGTHGDGVVLEEDSQDGEAIARVAALDIGKAELVSHIRQLEALATRSPSNPPPDGGFPGPAPRHSHAEPVVPFAA